MTSREINRAVAGAGPEWEALAHEVFRVADRIARRGARYTEDVGRDVASRVLGKLRADDGAALRRFVDTQRKYPALTFDGWLGTVVRNALIDHVRAIPEMQRRRVGNGRELSSVELVPLAQVPEPVALTPGADIAAEAARLVELVTRELPELQQRAIVAWLSGNDHDETADELGLAAPEQSVRLLNAARQRLRRIVERPRATGAK